MFTGIVQGIATVVAIEEKQQFRQYTLELSDEMLTGLVTGASVANNGCCLTVTKIHGNQVSFDLMKETLRVTNLADLQTGDRVNIERAAKFGDEIGGHITSGHIMTQGEITKIISSENNRHVWFTVAEPGVMKYIFPKGFIALDGISLTIAEVTSKRFSVYLIPETLQRTTLGRKKPGQWVNIEIDAQTQAVVDTTERVLARRKPATP